MRIFNEVATLFLVSIVFVVELQHAGNWVYGTLGLVGFGITLMLAIKIYGRIREGKKS
jgi:putative membrane protein